MSEDALQILMIEDEKAEAHLAKLAFKATGRGSQLQHVRDGQEALDYLNKAHGEEPTHLPDLILLDLNMPRMDGRTFLQHVKDIEVLSDIPIVVVTTSEAQSDLWSAYENAAEGYLVKPLDIDEFYKLIDDLEVQWIAKKATKAN